MQGSVLARDSRAHSEDKEYRADAKAVDLGDVADLELDPPFTIAMWVNLYTLPSVAGGSYRLFSKSDETGDQREWAITLDSGTDMLELNASHDGTGLSGDALVQFGAVDVDRWVHVCLVVASDGSVQAYRDGQSTGSGAVTPTIFHGNTAARIGSRNPSGRYSDLRLDELAVFTRALDAGEIQSIAQAQATGNADYEF